ncbi:MAG TPA: serine/threonine-protein kinase [Polyangia bacterium]|nr:serine/threonine-protein kinase [Polyangia bacterium]
MTALVLSEGSARYRPLAPIGRGGMAEVLLALQDVGGGVLKVVVLKRIWPDLATDRDFVTMFRDEARLAIRLNHPNVVQTLEVVEEAGQIAIAMEYLHGQPLSALLNHHLGGPHQLNLSLRLRVLADVLAGLHYAHELTDYDGSALGVVHRDVNPHNVFITYDGQVKLMDFGVAKTVAANYQTRPGAIKGKLAYLAPEYLRNDGVDRRADVFAAGVMLWELLAGRRLWQGMSEAQIVHLLAVAVPAPALPPDAARPPVLDAICARALAMNPDERYPTAAELEMDLQHVLAAAPDSHARTLGRVVTHAFAKARAEREALIAGALETGATAGAPVAAREAYWTKESDWPRETTWAREVDAFLSAAEDVLDVTVVDTSGPPEPPPEVEFRRPVPPPPPPPARAAFRRRVGGAIATLVISGGVLTLIAVEMQRSAAPTPVPAPQAAVAPAPPPPAAESPRESTPTPTFGTFSGRPSPLPPSLVADELSTLRLQAERLEGEKADERPATPGRHHRRAEGTNRPPVETSGAPAPSPSATTENLRPAALRTIDEGDPYK